MTQKVEPVCQNCKQHEQGVINNYPWQECKKIGLINNMANFTVLLKTLVVIG